MKNEAKRCRWSGWSARLCGLALLVALCAPVRVVGDEQLDQQLANERQALQGLLNNPNTNAETKALVREMLDWNARGRSVAEFQQTHTQPAAAHHTAASAAGDAIFGGGLRQAGVPAMQPVTGGHIPAPSVTRRIAVAGEEGGLRAASPAPMVIKRITDTLSDGLINRATAVTAASQVRGKTENFHADTVEILRESKSAQSGVGDVLIKGKSTSDTLAKGALLQSEISRFKETARSGAEAAPAKKTAVAAWGDPDTFSLQRLQPRGEMVVGKQLSESAQNAVGVKKEQTVGVWAEPNMAHTNQLIARKKVYTGPLNEAGGKGAAYTQSNVIGGKGEAYQQQMQAATQRLREESVNRASQTPLTPMRTLNTGPAANNNDSIKRSLNSDFGHAIGAPLAPVSDSGRKAKVNEAWNGIAGTTAAPLTLANQVPPAAMVPGVSYHTPPPGYRGSDVIKIRDLAVPPNVTAPVQTYHTPPPKPAATTVAVKPIPQIMMVDSFCPRHGAYGGQYRVGEKVECPKCKAERAQAAATTVHTPPPKPAVPTVAVKPIPQIMMVDAFCPKHGKYGGQYRVGEKVECPKCKAEKAPTLISRPATVASSPVTVHTPPPRPAAQQVVSIDAFCPKHGKYGGQVRPGEKLECPKCKAEKNPPYTGIVR